MRNLEQEWFLRAKMTYFSVCSFNFKKQNLKTLTLRTVMHLDKFLFALLVWCQTTIHCLSVCFNNDNNAESNLILMQLYEVI